ncbi:hypothetical protein [Gracilimonas sp.]|uniref:hypothetical protein n=1 Tax=Gracilimonas sp. TaxID=1974203 RepID=UPI0032F05AD2
MKSSSSAKRSRSLIRLSLLLLIVPGLYLSLWFSISGDQSLTYFEQVRHLMSYFPEPIRNPYGITLTFFGMSLSAAILSFYGYLKSESKRAQMISVIISCVATLLSAWLGMTIL